MRMLSAVIALLVPVVHAADSFAQGYPAKPVRVINPFAPGGGLDVVLRPVLQKMSDNAQQQFFVDNRPGASGLIGTEAGVKAPPDGYTLVAATTGTLAMNVHVFAKVPFDPLRDLAPISYFAETSFVLVAHPALPAKNVRELVALARPRPRQLTYGSVGFGSSPHLGGEFFARQHGIELVHVPFKGSLPMLTDIMGGHIGLGFDSTHSVAPHVRSGRLKALGIAAKQRYEAMPEIPTIRESGGTEFLIGSWYGLLAPAGTPADIIARVHAEVVKAVASPDLRARFAATGSTPVGSTPEEFAAVLRADHAKWGKVVRDAAIRAD